MQLYFLRHGKAEEHMSGTPDRERHLVVRGADDAECIAGLLRSLAVPFDHIFTSPYPRAQETARIVAETLAVPHLLVERMEMESGRFGMGSLQKLTTGQKANASLLFVGHEPDLSQTIEMLCGAACEMKTASLAHLSADRVEPGGGILHWLVTPKLLQMSP
jgi:phosphohistidine phosphatase